MVYETRLEENYIYWGRKKKVGRGKEDRQVKNVKDPQESKERGQCA